MTLGTLGLVIVVLLTVRRHPALFTTIMGLGALVWLMRSALWLTGRAISYVVLWWAGFLVLTIIGERSRLLRLSRPDYGTFLLATGLFLADVILTEADLDLGTRLAGVGMLTHHLVLLHLSLALRVTGDLGPGGTDVNGVVC